MAALKPIGFWSYTSRDDQASAGRLSQLRRLLANQLQGHVGRGEVHIFQDVAAIPPGTEWEQQIDQALEASSFFIPIITPGFLQSEWCCKEVTRFRAIMERRGRTDLILPMHYLDVGAFDTVRRGECFDPAVLSFLRTLQWTDFRGLRLRDPGSEAVQQALDVIAQGILGALYREIPPVPSEPPDRTPETRIDAPATPERVESKTGAQVAQTPSGPAPSSPEPMPSAARAGRRKPAWWVIAAIPAMLLLGWLGIAARAPAPLAPSPPASLAEKPASAVAPQAAVSPPKALRDTCPSTAICPEMVLIPHGSFMMGTTDAELTREKVLEFFASQEKPRRKVNIATDFYLAKYDVTVAEFRAFVRAKGARPAGGCDWEHPGFAQTDRDPVVCVSFDDAMAYVDWLNAETHSTRYSLPTEAQWEYAARAGTQTARFWGDDRGPACQYANVADVSLAKATNTTPAADPEVYFNCEDHFVYTSPVGSFFPNAFGLYDMLGNAWQWIDECWHDGLRDQQADGTFHTTGSCSLRALRGGAWNSNPRSVRAGDRVKNGTGNRYYETGFRVARTL